MKRCGLIWDEVQAKAPDRSLLRSFVAAIMSQTGWRGWVSGWVSECSLKLEKSSRKNVSLPCWPPHVSFPCITPGFPSSSSVFLTAYRIKIKTSEYVVTRESNTGIIWFTVSALSLIVHIQDSFSWIDIILEKTSRNIATNLDNLLPLLFYKCHTTWLQIIVYASGHLL